MCLAILWGWRLTLFQLGFFNVRETVKRGEGAGKITTHPKIRKNHWIDIKFGTNVEYNIKLLYKEYFISFEKT